MEFTTVVQNRFPQLGFHFVNFCKFMKLEPTPEHFVFFMAGAHSYHIAFTFSEDAYAVLGKELELFQEDLKQD